MAPPTAAAAPDGAAISGFLLSEDGTPLTSGTLTLALLDETNPDWVTSTVLDTAVSDRGGHFELVAESAELPATTDPVPLELSYDNAPGETGLIYDFRAIPAESGGLWQLELPTEGRRIANPTTISGYDVLFGLGAGLLDVAPAASGLGLGDAPIMTTTSSELEAGIGEDGATDEETQIGSEEPPTPAGYITVPTVAALGGSCPAGYPSTGWTSLDSYKWNYAPVRHMHTRDKSSQGYTLGRSNESSLSIAMDVDGKKYKGGLSGSYDQRSDLTMEPWVGNGRNVMFKMKWRYVKQRKWCMPSSGTWIYWTNAYRWVPKNATGGNKIVDVSAGIQCGGTGPAYNDFFGAKTTVSRESTATYKGYFTINNVKLDLKQLDRDTQKFWIDPDDGVNAKACGSNDAPMYASLVREVLY